MTADLMIHCHKSDYNGSKGSIMHVRAIGANNWRLCNRSQMPTGADKVEEGQTGGGQEEDWDRPERKQKEGISVVVVHTNILCPFLA